MLPKIEGKHLDLRYESHKRTLGLETYIRYNNGYISLRTYSLRKAELAAELAKLIPLKFKEVIFTLDQSRYDFIKLII